MNSEADGFPSQDILIRPSPGSEKKLRAIAVLDPALIARVVTLAKRTRAMIIERTWPNQSAKVVEEIDELVRILQDESTSMLELLVIESVVTAYVRLCGIEQFVTAVQQKPLSRSAAVFWDRTHNESQKRFLRAAETLAKIRRLAAKTPQLQLNITNQQQVNLLDRTLRE